VRANGRTMWLWWFLGVLVAGCNSGSVSNSTSQAATLILLGFTPTPATPIPTLRLMRTPIPTRVSLVTLAPTLMRLHIPVANPTCYETTAGSLLCLGQIQNSLAIPLEQIMIRVYLVTADGTGLLHRDIAIACSLLMPDHKSPYGVIFESIPEGTAGAVAVVINALEASPHSIYGLLEAGKMKIEQQDSLYRISGQISNRQITTLTELSLVVTLLDENNRITGFRQYRWPSTVKLNTSESISFSIEVIPQTLGTTRFEVNAEGKFS
jgi:hypothetical protein